jgi:hypothetical protein
MYLRWLFYLAAAVQLIFGLGFLLVPEAVASSYGAKADATTIATARYWAATLVPLGYVSWIAARSAGSPLKLQLTRAFEFIGILNIVVTLLAMSSGVIATAGGVFNIALGVIFTVGFGYYGWAKTEAALR